MEHYVVEPIEPVTPDDWHSQAYTALKKLSFKERIQKYVAHQKQPSLVLCIVIICLSFGLSLGMSLIPRSHVAGNPSTAAIAAQLSVEKEQLVTAAFVGDVMLGRSIQRIASAHGYERLFEGSKELWQGFDLVLGNFDGIVSDSESVIVMVDREPAVAISSRGIPALQDVGFTLMNLANDQSSEGGAEALVGTLSTFEKNSLATIGAGRTIERAFGYHIVEKRGVRIAVISMTDLATSGFVMEGTSAGILSTRRTDPSYLDAIATARRDADLVIAYINWGNGFTTTPSTTQRDIGRNLINAGADYVIGNHTTMIQPIELYRGKTIFYGLGDFVSDKTWGRAKDSIVVRIGIDDRARSAVEIVPMHLREAIPYETSNPLYCHRIYRILTRNLDAGTYSIKDNRLYLSPIVPNES